MDEIKGIIYENYKRDARLYQGPEEKADPDHHPSFGISIAVFLTGYLTTHTRNNLLTIVAILGCPPAARSAVGMIMLLPYRSFEEEKVRRWKQRLPEFFPLMTWCLPARRK